MKRFLLLFVFTFSYKHKLKSLTKKKHTSLELIALQNLSGSDQRMRGDINSSL